MMVVPLPIGEPDDARRLQLIAAETTRRKTRHRPQGGTLFCNVPAQRAFLRLAPYQHLVNTYAANVPGPPGPLYFAGARLLEVFPVVPIVATCRSGGGAVVRGTVQHHRRADREACPDIGIFAEGVRRSLDTLAVSVPVGSSTRS